MDPEPPQSSFETKKAFSACSEPVSSLRIAAAKNRSPPTSNNAAISERTSRHRSIWSIEDASARRFLVLVFAFDRNAQRAQEVYVVLGKGARVFTRGATFGILSVLRHFIEAD